MDEVELRTNISRKITGLELVKESELVEEGSPEVPEILKSGLQGSWISKFFTRPDQIVVKSQDPEMVQFQDKMEADMQEQKLTSKAVKAQLMEVMIEQKR